MGPRRWCACILTVTTVLLFSALPLLQILWTVLTYFGSEGKSSLQLLTNDTVRRATVNSLLVAIGSSLLAMLVGISVTLALICMRLRTRRVIAFLFVLSLMVAPQVSALAFKTLAGPASPLLNMFAVAPPPGTSNIMLGLGGIILVMGLHHAPLVAITFAAGLSRVPNALVEAASLDGANSWQVLTKILLPVTRIYLMAAVLLAFVAGIGNFGIPALLGSPVGFITLPTLVFQELASFGNGGIKSAAMISMIIAIIAGVAILLALRLTMQHDIRLDGGEELRPFIHGVLITTVLEISLWVFISVAVVLPLISLLATALVPAYGVSLNWNTVTLTQFTEVLWRQQLVRRAFANSLTYAGVSASILAFMSLIFAYVIDRRLSRFRTFILAMVEMPYALPGVVVAIACILLFVKPIPLIDVSLYGTSWIIVFAYLISFFAIALKPVIAAMMTLDQAVEEAALLDGATVVVRLHRIILPLVLPSVVAGGVMVFLLAFNELTISVLLWSAGTETLGVALINLEDAGLGAEAAALAVVATLVIAVLMILLESVGRCFPDGSLPWRTLGR